MVNRTLTQIRSNTLIAVQIALLAGVSLLLRLTELGYSNFQGDELNALCKYSDYKSILQFLAYLLGQQKGPVQYVLTCAYSLVDPNFSSELAIRLPFALANLAALTCFFLLVRRLFSSQVALYASFLFAVNGIFIAFARIVQYQSFVILGGRPRFSAWYWPCSTRNGELRACTQVFSWRRWRCWHTLTPPSSCHPWEC